MPRIGSMIEKTVQYSFFNAYHQISITEEKKIFGAFETYGLVYSFRRIPFGVINGVACFQRVMDEIIQTEN